MGKETTTTATEDVESTTTKVTTTCYYYKWWHVTSFSETTTWSISNIRGRGTRSSSINSCSRNNSYLYTNLPWITGKQLLQQLAHNIKAIKPLLNTTCKSNWHFNFTCFLADCTNQLSKLTTTATATVSTTTSPTSISIIMSKWLLVNSSKHDHHSSNK